MPETIIKITDTICMNAAVILCFHLSYKTFKVECTQTVRPAEADAAVWQRKAEQDHIDQLSQMLVHSSECQYEHQSKQHNSSRNTQLVESITIILLFFYSITLHPSSDILTLLSLLHKSRCTSQWCVALSSVVFLVLFFIVLCPQEYLSTSDHRLFLQCDQRR